MMTDRIISADKKYRKKVLILYLIFASLGAVSIHWGLPWVKRHIQDLEQANVLNNLILLIRFMFLSIVPLSLYLLSYGRKVLTHKRYPPFDTKVIKDTKILEGKKALLRGRLITATAVCLIAVCLIGGLYLPYKLKKAFGKPAASGNELICEKFQEKLVNLKHQKSDIKSALFEFDNKIYKGCELNFETKWSDIGMDKDIADLFYPHLGSKLFNSGWRSDDSYLRGRGVYPKTLSLIFQVD
ncbi:MAG: hypothetical protein ACR2PH_00830 [Desulfobulbia bacterium]